MNRKNWRRRRKKKPMSSLLKNIIRFVLFILVQVFFLFQVKPLHQFIVSYLYFLYILWLPFNTPRITFTFIGFIFGLSLDYFTKTPGLHAAPCTLIAYLRPFLVNILIQQEGAEQNYASPRVSPVWDWLLTPLMSFILTLMHQRISCIFRMDGFRIFWIFSGKSS